MVTKKSSNGSPSKVASGSARSRDTYEADKLVFTAGAWNQNLLGVLDGLATPERQVLAWLQPTRLEHFQPDTFPVFNLLVDEGRFYGFPVFGVPGFKFGKYFHLEEQGDAEELDREVHGYDERVLREFAERYFPEGCGPTMSLHTCMFTNTPDHHFVIDLHPDYEQVSIASACSGHGFKFASVIGEILADLAETGITRHNIDLFRLDRFQRRGKRRYEAGPVEGSSPSAPPRLPGATAASRRSEEDRRAHEQNGTGLTLSRRPRT